MQSSTRGSDVGRNLINLMNAAVGLSESLNFSRAARKLHISQPTLTKQVAALEDWVGVPLFERDRQTVTVTDAGRAYVEQARLALLYGERALQAARAVVQNADVVLNIGRSPYTDPFLISTLLSIQLPLYPQLRIELSSRYSCDQVDDLLAGGLDLAIATEPPESPLLTTVKIAESPFYIAMSEANDLARQSSITLDALSDRTWILFERRLHPPLYDSVIRLAEKRTVMPAKIQHVIAPEEAYGVFRKRKEVYDDSEPYGVMSIGSEDEDCPLSPRVLEAANADSLKTFQHELNKTMEYVFSGTGSVQNR